MTWGPGCWQCCQQANSIFQSFHRLPLLQRAFRPELMPSPGWYIQWLWRNKALAISAQFKIILKDHFRSCTWGWAKIPTGPVPQLHLSFSLLLLSSSFHRYGFLRHFLKNFPHSTLLRIGFQGLPTHKNGERQRLNLGFLGKRTVRRRAPKKATTQNVKSGPKKTPSPVYCVGSA